MVTDNEIMSGRNDIHFEEINICRYFVNGILSYERYISFG